MASTSVVPPVAKKSSDSMPDYIVYFERLSKANGWDDAKQATIFPSLLEVGCKSLDGLSDATLSSFSAIKKSLLGETEPFRESNLAALWHINRRSGETLQDYRERVSGLVEKVYPKFAAANKQCLIRDIFVHSLPSDYQKFLIGVSSTKIEEALNSALLYESMRDRVGDANKPKPGNFRNPKNDSSIANQSKSNHSSTGKKDMSCHFCGIRGHFARDCYKKKRASQTVPATQRSVDSMAPKYYAPLQVGSHIEEMLVDTGAMISVLPVSRYCATQFSSVSLKLADGSNLRTSGTVTIYVGTTDGKYIGEHEFCVADVAKAYLGADLLEKMDAVIHLKGGFIDARTINTQIPLRSNVSESSTTFPVLADIDFIDDVEFLTGDVVVNDIEGYSGDNSKLNVMLDRYEKLFGGIGKTDLVQHYIATSDNVPINLPSYRVPLHLREKARNVIDEYLENDIIRASSSEYCSPVLLVKKT